MADRPGAAGAGRAADGYRDWTGRPPEGVWRAPGRVNLIGEHLDYNGGHVLPIAIDRAVWVAVGRRSDPVLRVRSSRFDGDELIALDTLDRATGWAAYPAGVLWALADLGIRPGGLEVYIDSDVPPGGGLASSAAVQCATGLAAADLAGWPTDDPAARRALARAGQRAETVVVGAPVGIMDQTVALLARADHALSLDTRTLAVDHVPLPLAAAGFHLLVVDTGEPHAHAANEYAARRSDCERAAAALGRPHLAEATEDDLARLAVDQPVLWRRAHHVVSEEARTGAAAAALAAGRIDELGPLMTASHRSLQRDFANSTAMLDAVVDAALDGGAAGARMTGGGWGGAAIVLVATPELPAVSAAVTATVGSTRRRPADAAAPVFAVAAAGRAERVA